MTWFIGVTALYGLWVLGAMVFSAWQFVEAVQEDLNNPRAGS